MYFSPKTSADGLVFHYDTGNTVRSYLGEPTTNLNPYTLSDSGTDGSGQGSVGTRTILSSNHVRIVDVDSNTRQTHLIQGLTGGTTYTISVEFKKLSGTPTFRFQIQDHSGGSFLRTIKFTDTSEIGIEDKEGWQRAFWTFTLGGDANAVRIWYQDGADYTTYTHAFELRNPQLEAKSHPTPFTPPSTTRSATQGLKDLTGSKTIDLSNMSFDSNAQMTFDGTNDKIGISNFNDFVDGQPFTIETVARYAVAAGSGMVPIVERYWWADPSKGGYSLRLKNYSTNVVSFGAGSGDSTWNGVEGTTTIQTNKYYHVVGTYTNGILKVYVNGTIEGTTNGTAAYLKTQAGKDLMIGARGDSQDQFAQQDIPLVRFFNRALTADEVARNFNAIKSRFNIG